MYTATMHYRFKPGMIEQASELWKEQVMEQAVLQSGFVRMQFLISGDEALAIGTWDDQESAQVFMQTGVFSELMKKLESMVSVKPEPKKWDLRFYAEKS